MSPSNHHPRIKRQAIKRAERRVNPHRHRNLYNRTMLRLATNPKLAFIRSLPAQITAAVASSGITYAMAQPDPTLALGMAGANIVQKTLFMKLGRKILMRDAIKNPAPSNITAFVHNTVAQVSPESSTPLVRYRVDVNNIVSASTFDYKDKWVINVDDDFEELAYRDPAAAKGVAVHEIGHHRHGDSNRFDPARTVRYAAQGAMTAQALTLAVGGDYIGALATLGLKRIYRVAATLPEMQGEIEADSFAAREGYGRPLRRVLDEAKDSSGAFTRILTFNGVHPPFGIRGRLISRASRDAVIDGDEETTTPIARPVLQPRARYRGTRRPGRGLELGLAQDRPATKTGTSLQ